MFHSLNLFLRYYLILLSIINLIHFSFLTFSYNFFFLLFGYFLSTCNDLLRLISYIYCSKNDKIYFEENSLLHYSLFSKIYILLAQKWTTILKLTIKSLSKKEWPLNSTCKKWSLKKMMPPKTKFLRLKIISIKHVLINTVEALLQNSYLSIYLKWTKIITNPQ